MCDYYLFRKYGVCALSNYFKAMTSSRMYIIFVILAILMTSSLYDVIKNAKMTKILYNLDNVIALK